MAKNLVIVESPAKAKTIEKFLGKDYEVRSSFGHIRDLPKKGLNIDIEDNFEPKYEITADKRKIVSELKKAAQSSEVWLASDEDREGEAIAWHLTQALGLDPKTTKRIVFHEITKTAIDNAIKQPRTIDEKLVDAQQARRVLDRLVGYELSPVLWKKVRTGLSAGRVQSVAVRLIVDREREIRNFEPASNYKVKVMFISKGRSFPAELNSRIDSLEETEDFLKHIASATYSVEQVDDKPGIRNPSAPFITSTLQQEASRRLGFSVRQTMTLAQRLYESGHITYMRTDSTVLSSQAINTSQKYIIDTYGPEYHKSRQFKTKQASAQEAHEAIRPTNFNSQHAGADEKQKKLYNLIWRRTLASQMSPALTDKKEVIIGISNAKEKFIAKGEVLKFDGYMKVYGGGKDDTLLPVLSLKQMLEAEAIRATETFSYPPPRFSEAMLVKKLEELGIGRPSTYAPTISTVQTRGYVEKTDLEGVEREITELELKNGEISHEKHKVITGADSGKLVPTAIAEVTTDFLVKYFPNIVDFDFTAHVEADFDSIARGKVSWPNMIKDFYKDFHPKIEKTDEISRTEVSQARELGTDPKSKEPIFARFGRYGPMLIKGNIEDEATKPIFAPLPEGKTIDTVTLDDALTMFQLPRVVGKTLKGEEITANIGRFGPYIQVGKVFVSIKPLDPHTIQEDEARKLFEEKLKKDSKKNIKEFKSGIKILDGPYGPYVTDGKKNARINKDVDPSSLSEASAKELLDKSPARKSFARRRRTT